MEKLPLSSKLCCAARIGGVFVACHGALDAAVADVVVVVDVVVEVAAAAAGQVVAGQVRTNHRG